MDSLGAASRHDDLVGVDVLIGVDWGDVAAAAHVVNKVGGAVLNFYVPGGGSALANVVDEKIDDAQGKKPAGAAPGQTTPGQTTPAGQVPHLGQPAGAQMPVQPYAPAQQESFVSRTVVGPVKVWHVAAGAAALVVVAAARRAT